MSLQGKNALITGSTSGIGLGIAGILASQGCNIMLNGFGDAQEIENIRVRLEENHSVKALYNNADLSKSDDIDTLIKQTERSLGGIDILVNNAGIQHKDAIEDFPSQKWEAVIGINLSATFYTIKAAIPAMKKRGWGRIVNIASAHGLVASIEKAAYVAAKHGIVGLTKVVGLETAKENITCNAICPGWVLTPLVQQQIDDWAERDNISTQEASNLLLGEKQPSLEFVTPEDIGAMVAYLCSDAAHQVTGTALSIDGGWTAQ